MGLVHTWHHLKPFWSKISWFQHFYLPRWHSGKRICLPIPEVIWCLGGGNPLKEEMAICSSIGWKFSWTEKPEHWPFKLKFKSLMDCSLPGPSVHGTYGLGCHFLLQGIFLTKGSNRGLWHCRQMLSHHSTIQWALQFHSPVQIMNSSHQIWSKFVGGKETWRQVIAHHLTLSQQVITTLNVNFPKKLA